MVISEMAMFGTATAAEEGVLHSFRVGIHLRQVLAKCHVAVTFSMPITYPSGVTGALVTEL